MNILQSINSQKVLLRPFVYPEDKPDIADFLLFEVPLGIVNPTDPLFVQFEPYKNGYTFTFEFRSTSNFDTIAGWAQDNVCLDVLIPDPEQEDRYYRIGDKYGFKLYQFMFGFTKGCYSEYVAKFQTARPALAPYSRLEYTKLNKKNT